MAVNSSSIYQFKISLKGPKPKIWRRIQVPEEYNFKELHFAIQNAMGWENYHLHQFEIINPKTGQKNRIVDDGSWDEGDFDYDVIYEKEAKIGDYFLSSKDKAIYEYDFGIAWTHEIVLEKILPAVVGTTYPQCLAGKRACPPEDCVEPEGYDPEEFDPKLVTFNNDRLILD